MINKTNFIAVAIVAAAAFTAVPSANASVVGGMSSAAAAATTTSAVPAAQAGIVLVGGKHRHRGWRHGYGWGHGHGWGHGYGFRNCHWLKRKARRTGRKYWWNRYYNCRHGNFY